MFNINLVPPEYKDTQARRSRIDRSETPYARWLREDLLRRKRMDEKTLQIYDRIAGGSVSIEQLIADYGIAAKRIVRQLIEKGYICHTASG